MTTVHRSSSLLTIAILLTTFQQVCLGCFHDVESLGASDMWIQSTGIQSYLQYELGGGDMKTINVIPRGRDMSGQRTFKCVKGQSLKTALVELQQKDPSTGLENIGYQCLRFEMLSDRIMRLSRTEIMSSMDEVSCDTDTYTPDISVLVDASDDPPRPCLLHGSYQAVLYNPQSSINAKSFPETCSAKIHFNCNSKNVILTFKSSCNPPLFKVYSNKIRYHSTTQLSCIGDWYVGDGNDGFKVMVLRTNDVGPSLNILCLNYRNVNGSGENLEAYLSFDGRCASAGPFDSAGKTFSKNTMYGHLANFVSAGDTRCRDKFYLNQCQNRIVNCRETNACPSECDRCYKTPKPDKCKFMPETIGKWGLVDSKKKFSITVNKDGFESSEHGKFHCRYSGEQKQFYINPVVQYDSKDKYCMPLYSCIQIFNIAPGVSTFYKRRVVSEYDRNTGKNELATCAETNEIFKRHPVSQGQMMTLVNEAKLKPIPCNFGSRIQFPTTRGYCLFNVEDCIEKSCTALSVSYDNATCHENPPVLPVARIHKCYAGFKFRDGIRGILTYSDVLEKYACLIFTSTRLFVTHAEMCNSEGARRVYRDKHADVKFDPIEAFTVPVVDVPSSSVSVFSLFHLNFACIISCLLFILQKSLC